MLKRSVFLMVAFTAALMQSGVAFAELKVGVYDNRQILDSLPLVQKELQKLTSEFEPKRKEISDKQNKLLELKKDIETNGPVLSQSDLQAKQLEYQSKLRELQLLDEDTKRLAQVRQNEVVRNLQSMVEQEVLAFAKEGSYDLVLRSGVLYASPKVDITQEILKRLSEK
jgi:outer membrane protein